MSIFMFGKKKDSVVEESSLTFEEFRGMIKDIHLSPSPQPDCQIIPLDINTRRIKRLMWRNARRP